MRFYINLGKSLAVQARLPMPIWTCIKKVAGRNSKVFSSALEHAQQRYQKHLTQCDLPSLSHE